MNARHLIQIMDHLNFVAEGDFLTRLCNVHGVRRRKGHWSWKFPFYHRRERDGELRLRAIEVIAGRSPRDV